MEEEDLFLVIVGDPSVKNKQKVNFDKKPLKKELVEDIQSHENEDVETVEVQLEVDSEGTHYNYVVIKRESPEMDDVIDSGIKEEYVSESSDLGDADRKYEKKVKKNIGKRRKQPTAEQRYSLVDKLRKTCPELEDVQLLVETLREIMGTVKRPELPLDHYTQEAQNKYRCTECDHLSISVAAAGRHYEELHGPLYLSCFACGMEFRCKYNLYRHEKRCLSPDAGIVLKARNMYLGRNTKIRPYIRDKYKLEKSLSNSIFKCLDCSKVFEARLDLFVHMSSHGQIVHEYQCPHCSVSYPLAMSLKNHIKSKHSGKEYICDYCKRIFKKKINLINHLDTHLSKKKYPCTDCTKRYSTKFALGLHVNRVHKNLPPPCVCEVCTKRYDRISQLKAHMKKEHQITLITESMILKKQTAIDLLLEKNAKLVTKAELERLDAETTFKYYEDQIKKEIKRKKATKKRFVCDDCSKSYACKTDLKIHIETVHLKIIKPVTCAICHSKYRRLTLLKKHMKLKHGMIIIPKEEIQKTLPKLTEEQKQEVLVVFKNDK